MNILCGFGFHKWIGAHSHAENDYDIEACLNGCMCVRCGGVVVLTKRTTLPLVKAGKIIRGSKNT